LDIFLHVEKIIACFVSIWLAEVTSLYKAIKMTKEEFIILAGKVADGRANIQELALYTSCFESYQHDPEYAAEISNEISKLKKDSLKKLCTEIKPLPVQHTRHKIKSFKWIWPAAAAVVAMVFGIWFFKMKAHNQNQKWASFAANKDIPPGHNGATLSLSNGKVIKLNGAKNGVIVGNASFTYNDGTRVDETAAVAGNPGSGALELTAATGRGQSYQIILSDGTKVWLNAATTLKFPSNFVRKKNREVEIDGEAYFEVFKDKSRPFIVATKKRNALSAQRITVLGTHFNINAYIDEPNIKTTLLEGSVRVSTSTSDGAAYTVAQTSVLKPNQQSVWTGAHLNVKDIDATSVVAWKNGEFRFDDETLGSIMRKISRWYNVDIVYKGIDPEKTYWGTISRFENVSKVLENLELTSTVNFKIEGRKIIVYQLN
jgi:transmembrane sensor